MFVNTLTVDDKYSLLNSDNFNGVNSDAISKKQKTFSKCFTAFLKFRLCFERFEKKDDPHRLYMQKTWLDKSLKIVVSENPSISDMVNGHKHCRNLVAINFLIPIDPWVGTWKRQGLP